MLIYYFILMGKCDSERRSHCKFVAEPGIKHTSHGSLLSAEHNIQCTGNHTKKLNLGSLLHFSNVYLNKHYTWIYETEFLAAVVYMIFALCRQNKFSWACLYHTKSAKV